MKQYIYNEQNGLWYELWGDYQPKKKNGTSAYGGSGICGISVSIKRRFIPAF